jgi:hypothetical protein
MYPSEGELTDMEAFFACTQLPIAFELNAATTINNLPPLVKEQIKVLKSGMVGDLVARVRWDDLCQIRQLLEKSGGIPQSLWNSHPTLKC